MPTTPMLNFALLFTLMTSMPLTPMLIFALLSTLMTSMPLTLMLIFALLSTLTTSVVTATVFFTLVGVSLELSKLKCNTC